MARVAITEFAAKKLLLGDGYGGFSVTNDTLKDVLTGIDETKTYVVKIDTGVKKRGLQQLLALDVPKRDLESSVRSLFKQGYARCLIEPYHNHQPNEERYLSLTLERDGLHLLHSTMAGVAIEQHKNMVVSSTIPPGQALVPKSYTRTYESFDLTPLLEVMHQYHMSFLEMNPYLISTETLIPLDLAVELDTAGSRTWPVWLFEHLISSSKHTEAEETINKLNQVSSASFNLHLLHPEGSILTMLSGGGASLLAIDTLVTQSLEKEIINYCEYSGSPTREETAVFSDTLLSLLIASNAKKKVVLIAGGVSNFTDVLQTFEGIADGILKNLAAVKKDNVCFIVRRGGVRQNEGLSYLKKFFSQHEIQHEVYGPELSLGMIGAIVKKYL